MAVAVLAGHAQQSGADPGDLAFEAASVKVTPSDWALRNRSRGVAAGVSDPSTFTRLHTNLYNLIAFAYRLQRYQLDGPPWFYTELYDVMAKAPPGTTREQQSAMLRHLLAERFAMRVHHEKRDMRVYDLVVDKRGPKLKRYTPGPASPADSNPPGEGFVKYKTDSHGLPVLPHNTGLLTTPVGGQMVTTMQGQESMAELAARLAGLAGRPVFDRTGLNGKYDYVMHWVPDSAPQTQRVADLTSESTRSRPSDPAVGSTLMQALRSQLGLRLEPGRAMIDVLVIDHVDKIPTPN